jgi:hypothetical protein
MAAHAAVGSIEVTWLDEQDPCVNPTGAKGLGELGSGAHDARNTPHPGSTVTKPATLSSSTARRAVLTLTSYSVAIARTLGSCSPGNHSPASMRSRRAALTAR